MARKDNERRVRINIHVKPVIRERVQKFAERNGLNFTDAYNQLIQEGLDGEDTLLLGGEVVAKFPDGTEQLMLTNRRGFRMGPTPLP